jgi:hypothetical protein
MMAASVAKHEGQAELRELREGTPRAVYDGHSCMVEIFQRFNAPEGAVDIGEFLSLSLISRAVTAVPLYSLLCKMSTALAATEALR